jgi:hypothetical protein
MMFDLQGKSYTFDDGNSITVIQVKQTDEERGGFLVTYHIKNGPGIPQKLILPVNEFIGHYGHLFGLADE